MEDDDDILDYTNSDDDAANEMDDYDEAIRKTRKTREDIAAIEADPAHDQSRLQFQQEALARCIREEEENAAKVEARRLREESKDSQRRAALADRVPLPSSSAPRPFDSIIEFWQNYAHASIPHHLEHTERPTKKARRIVETPEPEPSTSSSQVSSENPSSSHPLLTVFQTLHEYNSQLITYEPALDKMRGLWPNEADWKPLFDKLTELEPDDDSGPVIAEIDQAIARYRTSTSVNASHLRFPHPRVPHPRSQYMSDNEFVSVQTKLAAMSNNELITMLTTKSVPKEIESIIKAVDNSDSDEDDEEWVQGNKAQCLELEQDMLSKLLGVTTGLNNGIFLVRCTVRLPVSIPFSLLSLFTHSVVESVRL